MFKKISFFFFVLALLVVALSAACSDNDLGSEISVTPTSIATATATPQPTTPPAPANTPEPKAPIEVTTTPASKPVFPIVLNLYGDEVNKRIHFLDGVTQAYGDFELTSVKTLAPGETFPEGNLFLFCGGHYVFEDPIDGSIMDQYWRYYAVLFDEGYHKYKTCEELVPQEMRVDTTIPLVQLSQGTWQFVD